MTNAARQPVAVLTGFEPFAQHKVNPSWHAVQLAAARLRRGGLLVITTELPVTFATAPRQVVSLLNNYRPRVMIAAGVAGSARWVRFERLAKNLSNAAIPDNDGAQPHHQEVVPGAPVFHRTTLPPTITNAWTAAQIPWEFSDNAGGYVCNATFFALQQAAHHADWSPLSSGFIHVPPVGELPIETSALAIEIAVRSPLGDT